MKADELRQRVFAALFGGVLTLSFLKFGNPPIMEKFVERPSNAYEFFLGFPWPIAWGYWLLLVVVIAGLLVARWETRLPKWLLFLPVAWLVWQLIATVTSVDDRLSTATCKHFAGCVACFYLGLFALARVRNLAPFWTALLVGFVLVLVGGWEQHFGGLAESRSYFFTYIYPQLKEVPPEYLKKLTSDRIFSTLFYPNALAGLLLLMLPPMLVLVWRATGNGRFTYSARSFLVGLLLVAALACLWWSGSKGGWLLMLGLGLLTLLYLPLKQRLKVGIICFVLVAGLGGFFWKYAGFFRKGATSVSARFDYWHAAGQTALAKPLLGSGPGTFAIPYQKLKHPESEMARLVHNDYLEQASDSGFPGAALYLALIVAGLTFGRVRGGLVWPVEGKTATAATPRVPGKKSNTSTAPPRKIGSQATDQTSPDEPATSFSMNKVQHFAIWLGLVGWALQGCAEFGLYLPALAWPAFALLGLLLGRTGNAMDKAHSAR